MARSSRPTARLPAPLPYAAQVEIFERFAAAEANPETELEYTSPYTMLVAVALSAQSTDLGVNKATRVLFAKADTPRAMIALGEAEVMEAIRTLGLFRQKAKNVIRLSELLVEHYGGEVPASRAALTTLPGVGRKTANVVLNAVWGLPAHPVDTHVFRVANRTRIAPGRTVDAVERVLEDNVPAFAQTRAHHWLILHGRHICRARAPRCADCLIRDLCPYPEKTA